MKFGEALRNIFEAHYKDLASDIEGSWYPECTRYTSDKLREAVKVIPWSWKRQLAKEFGVIYRLLENETLKCSHENIKPIGYTFQECLICGCVRRQELIDNNPNSYDERTQWGEWKL